jgi:hypothetical protein
MRIDASRSHRPLHHPPTLTQTRHLVPRHPLCTRRPRPANLRPRPLTTSRQTTLTNTRTLSLQPTPMPAHTGWQSCHTQRPLGRNSLQRWQVTTLCRPSKKRMMTTTLARRIRANFLRTATRGMKKSTKLVCDTHTHTRARARTQRW